MTLFVKVMGVIVVIVLYYGRFYAGRLEFVICVGSSYVREVFW